MQSANRVTKVAIVGAGGNVGSFMTKSLLATGKHNITALSRVGSQRHLPDGVIAKEVDYARPETLVNALRGQDTLVITLSGMAPKETQSQLIHAAGEAGVPWIMPNEWAPDTANEYLVNDMAAYKPKVEARKEIENLGRSSYIALCTGYWYEWTLAKPLSWGFDFANRKATFFDEGNTKISTSTWPQVGRAVAAILSLPIQPEGSNPNACLNKIKNKVVYTSSFTVSQNQMLESVIRVTGTTHDDWTITKEPSSERYATGAKEVKEGNFFSGFSKMGCRVLFPDGSGNFEDSKGTLNDMLGLPKEDIDEATKVAVDRAQAAAN